MTTIRRPVLAIFAACMLLLTVPGCVTHVLLVIVGEQRAEARYSLQGDSLDVFDARIPWPDPAVWEQTGRTIEIDSSGNQVARFLYHTNDPHRISHPLAPLGKAGVLTVSSEDGLFRLTRRVTATFPGWQATERYGDPDAHIPADILELEESGMDTVLSEEAQEELDRVKARAMQKAAVERYLRQVERLVRSRYPGDEPDSAAVLDASRRFAPIVRAHVMTFLDEDPMDVSLEWYAVLRLPMAMAASEATGLPFDSLLAAADSLDDEYQRWIDLQDDTVEFKVLMEGLTGITTSPKPSETRGDTLVWSIGADDLADEDITIIVAGYEMNEPAGWAVIGVLAVVAIGLLMLILRRHSRSRK